jgi:transcriptional regulator with XRE-family HTH domain
MEKRSIGQKIAFLRREKGVTQEALAQALGVTNQSVSKWESEQCCPDITLLPPLAGYFGVTTDMLLGADEKQDERALFACLRQAASSLSQQECLALAQRAALCLHTAVLEKGAVPWDRQKPRDYSQWGFSALSEPFGVTIAKGNAVFFSLDAPKTRNPAGLRQLHQTLAPLADFAVLRALFALWACGNAGNLETLGRASGLKPDALEAALEQLPVVSEQAPDGAVCYRLEGCAQHIAPLLALLCAV